MTPTPQPLSKRTRRGHVVVVGRRMSTRAIAAALERVGANVRRGVPAELDEAVRDDRTLAVIAVARLRDELVQTAGEIARRETRIPVFVAITGDADDEAVHALYAAGIEGVFVWPHDRRGLLYAVMEVDSVVAPGSRPRATNRELARRVRKRLASEPVDFGRAIRVRALDDVVVLDGEVDALWKVARAREVVRSIPSVARVIAKRLEVSRSELPDRSVADHVRRMLRSAGQIDASTIAVSVDDGVVTLAGTVESHTEMERLTGLVEHIIGVRGIRNLTTVSKTAKRTDRATARDVRAAIAAELPLADVDASVFSGVAVLAGRVRRSSDASTVQEIAQRQPGVERVVNNVWPHA